MYRKDGFFLLCVCWSESVENWLMAQILLQHNATLYDNNWQITCVIIFNLMIIEMGGDGLSCVFVTTVGLRWAFKLIDVSAMSDGWNIHYANVYASGAQIALHGNLKFIIGRQSWLHRQMVARGNLMIAVSYFRGCLLCGLHFKSVYVITRLPLSKCGQMCFTFF